MLCAMSIGSHSEEQAAFSQVLLNLFVQLRAGDRATVRVGDSYWDLIQQKKGINEGLRLETEGHCCISGGEVAHLLNND